MKQFGSVFLLFAVILQISGTALHLAGYQINKAYIASALCEKKDIPNNKCEGKCHLKKQLREDSERETEYPVQTLKVAVDWQVTLSDTPLPGVFPKEFKSVFTVVFRDILPGHPNSVFHPPSC